MSPDLARARVAVHKHAIHTPLLEAPPLTESLGTPVYLKLESLQVTGSFKVRGAAVKMEALTDDERARGVVACSSGNHGRAVARVARRLSVRATLCVPNWVDATKKAAMEEDGADVVLSGSSYDEAERAALALQESSGMVFVPPFDDPRVIAGQATLGLEIAEELPGVRTVLVPLSGGGLAGGIAYALDEVHSQARVVGVSAANAAVMLASLEAGEPVQVSEEETLANALSGGIGLDNRWTFHLIRDRVAEHRTVSEARIAGAMALAYRELGLVVEGGGAVALAAALNPEGDGAPPPGPVVVVVSGGNVDLTVLQTVLAGA